MKTMEEIINGLKYLKDFLNGRFHKGIYEQAIQECEDEEYKIRAKKIDLASQLYKADMEVLEDAIKHLKAEDTTNRIIDFTARVQKDYIINKLMALKRFLRSRQINHKIYGLSNEYLESPSDEIANAIFEKDQKDLEDIICFLNEVL